MLVLILPLASSPSANSVGSTSKIYKISFAFLLDSTSHIHIHLKCRILTQSSRPCYCCLFLQTHLILSSRLQSQSAFIVLFSQPEILSKILLPTLWLFLSLQDIGLSVKHLKRGLA